MISVFLNTTIAHSVEPCRPCVPCIYSTFLNHNLFAAPPRVDPTQNSAFSRFSLLIRTRHIRNVWRCLEFSFLIVVWAWQHLHTLRFKIFWEFIHSTNRTAELQIRLTDQTDIFLSNIFADRTVYTRSSLTCLFQTLTSSHINENLLPHGKDILSHLKKL